MDEKNHPVSDGLLPRPTHKEAQKIMKQDIAECPRPLEGYAEEEYFLFTFRVPLARREGETFAQALESWWPVIKGDLLHRFRDQVRDMESGRIRPDPERK